LALGQQGRFAEAEARFEQALRLHPHYAEAHANLASNYNDQGRSEEALAGYQQALRLQPNLASAHWNRALVWLQSGDYEHGWTEYEWRWQRKQTPPRPFRQPRWDGSPLHGRAILLHMEQGLGDMLQFIRYAPRVQQRGGRVLVECPRMVLPLFASCAGIDRLVPEGEPLPEFAVQAPLMSLPGLLGTTLKTIPAEVPYLSAPSD
jgi:tetratricopeptide (TPR) repeat protein